MRTHHPVWRGLILLGLALAIGGWPSRAAQPKKFDKLSEEDRQAFSKRFEKEIWPLMSRNGKNGCVGCHTTGKIVSSLHYKSNEPDQVFRKLLKEGYFLPDDVGGILYLVSSKDKKERMPKNQEPWTAAEIETFRQFVLDLEKKQMKPKAEPDDL
jgi:hypothetical protein